jgi:hypothetical protein
LQSWLASRYWGDWRTESRWLWRLSGTRLDVGLGEDIETQTWRHFALTPVETNDERFIRAIRQ